MVAVLRPFGTAPVRPVSVRARPVSVRARPVSVRGARERAGAAVFLAAAPAVVPVRPPVEPVRVAAGRAARGSPARPPSTTRNRGGAGSAARPPRDCSRCVGGAGSGVVSGAFRAPRDCSRTVRPRGVYACASKIPPRPLRAGVGSSSPDGRPPRGGFRRAAGGSRRGSGVRGGTRYRPAGWSLVTDGTPAPGFGIPMILPSCSRM
ncbi:hypothetical protein Asi02nite_64190 [Asanoa siamensis]|uniref:Uncharacterized protein n=1 Tax=Asanoa siamensis TaxID=926357 RepID=A0ABQ4D036_9ACTN|nr:hypothetical protein Asi02nite_64190 [Asanoa siamensis]